MAIIANAPVGFCNTLTSASGTSEQIFQVSTAGTTAGLPAGDFYLFANVAGAFGPSSNLIVNSKFVVTVGGWIKAHGTSQTVKPGLLWQTFTSGTSTLASSPADTFTTVASGTLTAGTVYDFLIEQSFYLNVASATVSGALPLVMVAGAPVTITTLTAPLAVNNVATASQTEPITGVNNSLNYPCVAFTASITNSVSDTTETALITDFYMSQA